MNTRTLSPEDYWRAVVSRKWLVISAILVSLSIAGAVCALMPKTYQSATKMWFEGAKIEESIVSGPNPAGMGYAPTLDDRVINVYNLRYDSFVKLSHYSNIYREAQPPMANV